MMKIRSTGKIVLSCFLSLCLLLSLVTAASLTSFAKGDEATAVTVVDVTGLTDAQKDGAHWVLESAPADKGGVNTDSFRIKHVASGKYFAVDADKNMVLSAYDANDQKQVWQVTDWYGYYWCLMNVAANGWLTLDANTKDLSLVSGDGKVEFSIITVDNYEAGKVTHENQGQLKSKAERDALNGAEVIIAQRYEANWTEHIYQLYAPVPGNTDPEPTPSKDEVIVTDVNALEDAQKDGTHWVLESAPKPTGLNEDSFRIKHVASGKYFAVDADGNMVLSAYAADDQKQVWQVYDWYGYFWCLMNVGANGQLMLDADTKDLSLVNGDGKVDFSIITVDNYNAGKYTEENQGQLKNKAERDALNGAEIIITKRFEGNWTEYIYQLYAPVPATDPGTDPDEPGEKPADPEGKLPESGVEFVHDSWLEDPESIQWIIEEAPGSTADSRLYLIKHVATGMYLCVDDLGDRNKSNDKLGLAERSEEDLTQVWKMWAHYGEWPWVIQNFDGRYLIAGKEQPFALSLSNTDPQNPLFSLTPYADMANADDFSEDYNPTLALKDGSNLKDSALGIPLVITPRYEVNWTEQHWPLYAAVAKDDDGDNNPETGDNFGSLAIVGLLLVLAGGTAVLCRKKTQE